MIIYLCEFPGQFNFHQILTIAEGILSDGRNTVGNINIG